MPCAFLRALRAAHYAVRACVHWHWTHWYRIADLVQRVSRAPLGLRTAGKPCPSGASWRLQGKGSAFACRLGPATQPAKNPDGPAPLRCGAVFACLSSCPGSALAEPASHRHPVDAERPGEAGFVERAARVQLAARLQGDDRLPRARQAAALQRPALLDPPGLLGD